MGKLVTSLCSPAQHRHPDALAFSEDIGLGEAEAPPSLTRGLWLHPFPGTTFFPFQSSCYTSHSIVLGSLPLSTRALELSLIMFQRPLTAQFKLQPTCHCSASHFIPSSWARGPRSWADPSFTEAQLCPTCRKSLLHSLHAGAPYVRSILVRCHFCISIPALPSLARYLLIS